MFFVARLLCAALISAALFSCMRAPIQTARTPAGPAIQCSSGPDEDRDGLSDDCELAYAATFAPVLRTAARGCNWDAQNERLGGGYHFAVIPVDAQTAHVFYLPAYYRDCGWSGAKCKVPIMDCSPHSGDSELIAIEVSTANVDRPVVQAVFLSAHCFGGSDADCRWYGGEELRRFECGSLRRLSGSRTENRPATPAPPRVMAVTGSTTPAIATPRRIAFRSSGMRRTSAAARCP